MYTSIRDHGESPSENDTRKVEFHDSRTACAIFETCFEKTSGVGFVRKLTVGCLGFGMKLEFGHFTPLFATTRQTTKWNKNKNWRTA